MEKYVSFEYHHALIKADTLKPVQTTTSYKTTTHLKRPILSLPKQIPMQSLLYKTTDKIKQNIKVSIDLLF